MALLDGLKQDFRQRGTFRQVGKVMAPEPSDLAKGIEAFAAEDMLPLVYRELRSVAARLLAAEAPGQTLQPTALVHEAYMRLVHAGDRQRWKDPNHFFFVAARVMRHILVDVSRQKGRQKRGGGDRIRVPLNPDRIAEPALADELLALHDALEALAAVEPAVAQLVELRYFGGVTIKAAAELLGIAPRTADAHWAYAKAWLRDEMARHAVD